MTDARTRTTLDTKRVFDGRRHVDSLDGLRALAILAVMLFHAGTPGFAAGWLGVDLFFVLSGFLITTLLLQEFERVGQVSYFDFLARRALRLMPIYVLYASIITYGIWGWSGSIRSEYGGWSATTYTFSLWGYFINFAPLRGIWNGQDITGQLWSLSVEQQYYLIWPVLVIALASRPRILLSVAMALTAGTMIEFLSLDMADGNKVTMLYSRGFTLVMASATAVAAYCYRSRASKWPMNFCPKLGAIILTTAFVLQAFNLLSYQETLAIMLPVLSVVFCYWVALLWYCSIPRTLEKVLLNPVMRYIGKISYGMYIYHELIRVVIWTYGRPVMSDWPKNLGFATRLALYLLLTVVIAAASYRFIESNFLRLRRTFRNTRPAMTAQAARATEMPQAQHD